MRVIELTFYKPSGKYYMHDTFNIPDEVNGWDIPDYVRDNCRKCLGMHIVVDDPESCPHLLLADTRRGEGCVV